MVDCCSAQRRHHTAGRATASELPRHLAAHESADEQSTLGMTGWHHIVSTCRVMSFVSQISCSSACFGCKSSSCASAAFASIPSRAAWNLLRSASRTFSGKALPSGPNLDTMGLKPRVTCIQASAHARLS